MVVNDWLARQDFEFACGVIALSVYTAAFIAEEIRSGIFAIPKNQLEASRACGLSFLQAMLKKIATALGLENWELLREPSQPEAKR